MLKQGLLQVAISEPAFWAGFDAIVRSSIPRGRWGEIDDVVAATLFLLSDEADFLQGVLLPVDGGETAGAAVLAA